MKDIIISKRTPRRGDDGHKIISLRIKQDTLEQIENIAKQTDRSRNELMNILLTAALENVTISE